MSKFAAHLHVHSEFSLLDGYSTIDEIVETAKKHGLEHVALTDHGTTSGLLKFYKKAKSEGINPILGVEFYWHPERRGSRELGQQERSRIHHFLVLAKNFEGYKNLLRLNTIAHGEGKFYVPQIDDEVLFEYGDGLIITSGCPASPIPRLLVSGDYEAAKQAAIRYRDQFGEDFYLEIQNHDSDVLGHAPSIERILAEGSWQEQAIREISQTKSGQEQLKKMGRKAYLEEFEERLRQKVLDDQRELIEMERAIREGSIELSRELGIKLVATNDSHYSHKDDAWIQDITFAMGQGKWVLDCNRYFFTGDKFYLRPPEEMDEVFADTPEALESTREIAEKCRVEIPEVEMAAAGEYQFPHFPDVPEGMTEEDYLRHLCNVGWQKYVQPRIDAGVINEDEYRERLEFELDTIIGMGWSGYFLIVWDILEWCRNNDVPIGVGRGSVGGALVAYLLEITEVDPLYMPIGEFTGPEQHPMELLFERFLNPDRKSPPDVDIDIGAVDRPRVIEYVKEKYGHDRVASIMNVTEMSCKSALKKVGTALRVSFDKMNALTKAIPDKDFEGNTPTIEWAVKQPDVKKMVEGDKELQLVVEIAKRMESRVQHVSTHAAGVIIANKPLWNYVSTKEDADAIVAENNMEDIETLGLLKMDLLGLRTLDVVKDTLRQVERNRGIRIDPRKDILLNDPDTYKLIRDLNVSGVFQIDTNVMKSYLIKNKPTHFEHLIEQVAIVRPGPLDAPAADSNGTMADEFFRRKHGESKIRYIHPLLEEALKRTYGVIVYQEQLMTISRVLAGYTRGESDELRKVVAKKQADKIEEAKKRFFEGAQSNEIPDVAIERIWSEMETFARYGFNRSHGAEYAYLCYRTAWLRAHYPVEFTAALLTSVSDNPDKFDAYLQECSTLGIKISPPDINVSESDFVADGDSIRFGLGRIKGVGSKALEEILRFRNEVGRIESIEQFLLGVDKRVVNKAVVTALIQAGCFDGLGRSRRTLMEGVETFLAAYKSYKGKMDRLERKREKINSEPISSMDEYSKKMAECDAKSANDTAEFEAAVSEAFSQDLEEYHVFEIMEMEKEVLGYYVSTSPLDWAKPVLLAYSDTTSLDMQNDKRNRRVKAGGTITKVYEYKPSYTSGKILFLTISDGHGEFRAVLQTKLAESLKPNEGEIITVEGNLYHDQKWGPTVKTYKAERVTEEMVTAAQEAARDYMVVLIDGLVSESMVDEVTSLAPPFDADGPTYRIAFQSLDDGKYHITDVDAPEFVSEFIEALPYVFAVMTVEGVALA